MHRFSVIAVLLSLAVCLAVSGCGGGGGGKRSVVQQGHRASDETGTFSITDDGRSQIVVKDAGTGEPLEGITAEVVYNDTSAAVLLVDPNGNYIPRLAGVGEGETRLAYSLPKEYVLHQWSEYIRGGSQLVYDDRLPAGLTREMLNNHYVFWRQTTLGKLDITLMDFAQMGIDAGADKLIGVGLSAGIHPAAGATYETVTQIYKIGSLSNTIFYQTQSWKYRLQGYQDDQRFEIWRMKVFHPRLAWPFLVLPLERPSGSPLLGGSRLTYLRAELTWDTAGTDVDLHLVRPNGTYYDELSDCHFSNMNPDWGWQGDLSDDPKLDVDDRDGYGPENITISNPHDDGLYQLIINYYGDQQAGSTSMVTNAYLRVWINDREPFTHGPFELSCGDPDDGDTWLVLTISSTDGSVRSTRSRVQIDHMERGQIKKPPRRSLSD